jgi:hypothetical protein
MAGEEDKLEIHPDRAVDVRETRRLFRLVPTAGDDLGPTSRPVAIVAADTEDEARRIASMHDVFRRDWRDPLFAVAGVRNRVKRTSLATWYSVRSRWRPRRP